MAKLKAYSFFHLNMAYSAIAEEQRRAVIDRCYWPLLNIAKRHKLPFGIEASAWTLETIANLDENWLTELRELITDGSCEFIGSGYAQIIGPLTPPEINEANFRIGMQYYEKLLGLKPKTVLVNEQAFSAGLIPLYNKAGYESLIMEWDNPSRANPNWNKEYQYLPQYVLGTNKTRLPVIWNKSVAFQKVQRYVHGEIELDEYMNYIVSQIGPNERCFPIYGNDVEVFDFRPGRYMTEAALHADGEWRRLETMYVALKEQTSIEMIRPSEVLQFMDLPNAGNDLRLETAAYPIPVKKQDKYNIVRWAVTGRNDFNINTQCWQIFSALKENALAQDEDWRELCFLWSSDFRTHITDKRWTNYLDRLRRNLQKWVITAKPENQQSHNNPNAANNSGPRIDRINRFLVITGDRFVVRLNCHRGLALDSLIDRSLSPISLCGTLPHGYFDNIQWTADYYSGHLIFESPGRVKITDLNVVEPKVISIDGGTIVCAEIKTILGNVTKEWIIDEKNGVVNLSYRTNWQERGIGSLRLGYVTLNPEAFDKDELKYVVQNGGFDLETFELAGSEFDHGSSVSFLISTNQAVGLTNGFAEIHDNKFGLQIRFDKTISAAIGLLTHRSIGDKIFCRIGFSLQELDDTSRNANNGNLVFSISLQPRLMDTGGCSQPERHIK